MIIINIYICNTWYIQISIMEEIIESLRPISKCLDRIQSSLALDFLNDYLPVEDDDRFLFVNKEIIKSAILATGLGIQWGVHFSFGCYLLCISSWQNQQQEDQHDKHDQYQYQHDSITHSHRLAMAWTWCFYITAMCTFHLLEFYVTAFFNPTVVSSDSFLVNHSKAYTVAAIIASTEFWFRFWFFSDTSTNRTTTTTTTQSQDVTTPTNTIATNYLWISITILGILMVIVSQFIRSWAMMKCGESFNHYIQTQKKDNHILVTNGIYTWLRHPSYFGFYYWSIGTQLVLHNPFSCLLFALAGWKFFSQRIPYEERSLIRLFGDEYYDYVMRSYVGIPFIRSIPKDKNEEEEEEKDFQQQNGTEVELEEKEGEDDDKHHNGIEHEISNSNDNGYDKKIN
jgi:protein-S-isoprenylcysteine O-methyltransferase